MRGLAARVAVIAFPVIEVVLIIWVASVIGWGWTLAILAAGVVAGLLVMRIAGRDAFAAATAPMRGRQPYVEIDETTGTAQTVHPGGEPDPQQLAEASQALRESGLLFSAGVLLAVPGFLTDLIGLVLVAPPVRRVLAGRMPSGAATRRSGVVIVGETVSNADGTTTTTVWSSDAPPGGAGSAGAAGGDVVRGEILPPRPGSGGPPPGSGPRPFE